MKNIKIYYPIPLVDDSVIDDNVDFHIVMETGEVYFGFAATPENLRTLLEKREKSYFWDTDLIVVPDLRRETIRTAIEECLRGHYFEEIFTRIGEVDTVYTVEPMRFEDIVDPTFPG